MLDRKIVEYDRVQYELLLTVADVAAVRSSLEAKADRVEASEPHADLHSRFAKRAEELLQKLAPACVALGLGREYRAIVLSSAPVRQARWN